MNHRLLIERLMTYASRRTAFCNLCIEPACLFCYYPAHAAVPLYDSLGESSVEYIIGHSEASIVFTSTQKFPLLEKTLHKTKENIKTIVYFGDVTEDSKRTSQAAEREASLPPVQIHSNTCTDITLYCKDSVMLLEMLAGQDCLFNKRLPRCSTVTTLSSNFVQL